MWNVSKYSSYNEYVNQGMNNALTQLFDVYGEIDLFDGG